MPRHMRSKSAIEQIMEFDRIEGKKTSNILVLGRFGFDGDKLEKSGLFEYKTRGGKLKSVKYPKLDLTFMTAHASKGLCYDNVIVINGETKPMVSLPKLRMIQSFRLS